MFDNNGKDNGSKKNELIPKAIMTMTPDLAVQCIISRLKGEKDYYEMVSAACHAMAAITYIKHVQALEIMIEEYSTRGALVSEQTDLIRKLNLILNEAESKGYIV